LLGANALAYFGDSSVTTEKAFAGLTPGRPTQSKNTQSLPGMKLPPETLASFASETEMDHLRQKIKLIHCVS